MSDEWLDPKQTSEKLDCDVETVRRLLRDELLPGVKVNNQWRIKVADVQRFLAGVSAPPKEPSATAQPVEVDPGMVEVSIALAGIAAAMATFLPSVTSITEPLKWYLAILTSCLAFFSAYSALWLLACFCVRSSSFFGVQEIWKLLTSPGSYGPYWFVCLVLLLWLALSVCIGVLTIPG